VLSIALQTVKRDGKNFIERRQRFASLHCVIKIVSEERDKRLSDRCAIMPKKVSVTK
jgi:hypothetical protein